MSIIFIKRIYHCVAITDPKSRVVGADKIVLLLFTLLSFHSIGVSQWIWKWHILTLMTSECVIHYDACLIYKSSTWSSKFNPFVADNTPVCGWIFEQDKHSIMLVKKHSRLCSNSEVKYWRTASSIPIVECVLWTSDTEEFVTKSLPLFLKG